jgi:hypothetical protein
LKDVTEDRKEVEQEQVGQAEGCQMNLLRVHTQDEKAENSENWKLADADLPQGKPLRQRDTTLNSIQPQ